MLSYKYKGHRGLNREEMSNKLKKAVDLKKKGQNIKFLNEEAFVQKCKGK